MSSNACSFWAGVWEGGSWVLICSDSFLLNAVCPHPAGMWPEPRLTSVVWWEGRAARIVGDECGCQQKAARSSKRRKIPAPRLKALFLPPGLIRHGFTLSPLLLSKKIQDGSLPPEHVFYAYVGKALQIARETNCITEYMQESETQLQHTKPGEKKGLLYGVPVSIKDSINCQGHDSMLGFVKNIDKPVAEDSVLVQVLKRQGAIPFVKTNVPQSLISYDCDNLIFGQTCNPLLYTRTPGGSSGGEGALIGGGGSILGFGTDLGGSLRFPAAFCGICALKPTGNRLSKKGVISGIFGQKSVTAAVGPMAKDVESLALCMRALLCEDMFNLDSTVPPLPFNEEVYSSTRPLRIGYYETDFFTMPSPAMRRAVRETKQLLEEAGHTVGCCMNPAVVLQLCFLLASGPRSDHKAHLSGKGPSIRSTSHNISGWILGRISPQKECRWTVGLDGGLSQP
uniref:Amidase domain-containing protein n=1 Tax=Phasianus colchicus TaxID=9054 RepID=A0A669PCD1_PHACC